MHENCQPVNHPGSVHSGKGSKEVVVVSCLVFVCNATCMNKRLVKGMLR